MTTDPTTQALAEAMRSRVEGVTADPRLVGRAATRARSARRARAALVSGLAAASVLAVVGAAAALRGGTDAPRPQPPAAQVVKHARYAPATLPRGFEPAPFASASQPMPPQEDGRRMWEESLNYGRDFDPISGPKGVVIVTTVTGDVLPITLASYRDTEPTATVVVVGGRTVVHVRNMLAEPAGLDVYEWTEAPGININVTGMGEVTDAEVRAVVAALRRVQ